jgi:glycerol-3-phosphate O-acyltransferase
MLRREGIAREPIDDRRVIEEMVERVAKRLDSDELDILINDCCFKEEKRLRKTKDDADRAYLDRLRSARRRLAWASRDELRSILKSIVREYATEIHGHFDERTYNTATKVMPKGLALLLRKQAPWAMLKRTLRGDKLSLSNRIVTSGHADLFDKLVEKGTCVLVPTHVSNLDSPVIGFALHDRGLPPMIYGAGINLFSNWLLSYFMDHLGAYKVDRTKKNTIYLTTLKEYSSYSLEQRWHSLFFPGGTRARSGKVETRLKKGLMGTALDAYQANLRRGAAQPRIFFIPATLNYHLVLEAETLIDDYLQEEGQSRYIIHDDEFSRPDKVLGFVRNMMGMTNPIELVFGQPLDPFGNPVDGDGNSLDPQGRAFDPAGYLMRDGEVVADTQRDRVYTRRLSDAIGATFLRDTVVFDTHVLAAAMHRRLKAHHPGLDVYRRLLLGLDSRRFTTPEVDAEIEHMQTALRQLAADGQIRLGAVVAGSSAKELRISALKHFGHYHATRAVWGREGGVVLEDPKLALYYAHRLSEHKLPPPLPPDRRRS